THVGKAANDSTFRQPRLAQPVKTVLDFLGVLEDDTAFPAFDCETGADQWPNNGSRMNREVHVRFWESPEVKVLQATRHSLQIVGRRKSLHDCNAPNADARSERSRLSRRGTAVIGVSPWNVPLCVAVADHGRGRALRGRVLCVSRTRGGKDFASL